jgi:hypothetical protein
MENDVLKRLVANLEQNNPPSPTPRPRRIALLLFLVLALILLAVSATSWHHHRTQPISEEQRVILTALADQAAERTNQTRQKVWGKMKYAMGVRKIQDIQRKDFDNAVEILLQESR